MNDFVVSSLKYRPKTFETVVGQNHVTGTLKNSIKENKIPSAILFCGPRGVGKTSCARIYAREINKSSIENIDSHDLSFNVFELDAASNRGIEEMKNLIDKVRIPPQIGKYKVYIIDEVHMLSNAAFNAFLKTLEEPPSYAIFILATTEKNKVIPTILSRCQIYDFNRIEIIDIKEKLKDILNKEKIEFEDEALHIIAQKADGAMRDALSTLDLIRTFSKDSKITLEIVTKNLNILDNDYFFKVSNLLFESSISETLLIHNEILLKGFESFNLLNGLSNHFRNLLLSKNEKLVEIMEVSESEKIKYIEQAKSIDTSFIEEALEILNEFEINYKQSSNHKIHTEIALIKVCSILKKKTLKIDKEEISIPKTDISKKKELKENKPKEKKESKNKISQTNSNIDKDTPNLKNLLVEKEEVKVDKKNKEKELEKVAFSEDEYYKLIENFSEDLKEKKSEVAILKKRNSISGTEIIFHLDNELEGTIFDSIINRLKERIKHRFEEKIVIKKEINQSEKEKTIYTNKEKFEYLAKKNTNLTDLKNKLGLDYEF